jgi:anaerobic magnesium-protoporphyrin IX monomethyl ester cyclase
MKFKNDILFLEPPLFDCRAPHLGCAMLVAHAKNRRMRVKMRDLNQEALHWLFDDRNIRSMQTRIDNKYCGLMRVLAQKGAASLTYDEKQGLTRYFLLSGAQDVNFPRYVAQALTDLSTEPGFYNPSLYRRSRAVLEMALSLAALDSDPRLTIGIAPQQYNGRYRATSLQGLHDAVSDIKSCPFSRFYETDVVPWVDQNAPIYVGVSISNVFQVIPGIVLSSLLHQAGQSVIIGGSFFSKFAEQLTRLPDFFDLCDLVVIGEGEQVLEALGRGKLSPRELGEVPGVVFRDRSRVCATDPVSAPALADTAAADFRDLNLDRYLTPSPVLPILAGKGCGWGKCRFCEIPQFINFNRNGRRVRDPDAITDEIRIQALRHDVNHLVFTDESLEPALLAGLAERINRNKLDVNYVGYTRFSLQYTRSLCQSLAVSGCRKLLFGLESGSQSVNDMCNKGVDLQIVKPVVEMCQKAGIAVHIFAIVGLPGEGPAETAESTLFLKDIVHILDTPISTLDVSPFYLNWHSSLRRESLVSDISFSRNPDTDFPLHVDDYHFMHGMNHAEAVAAAESVTGELNWEASSAGQGIGYLNPLWPAWEEHAVLYLSHYTPSERRRIAGRYSTFDEVLDKTVARAPGFDFHFIKGHTSGLFSYGEIRGQHLAFAPSAKACRIDAALLHTLQSQERWQIGDLAASVAGETEGEPFMTVLAQVLEQIHTGTIEWEGESCRME